MKNKKEANYTFCEDTPNEGREKAWLDVDRMINEGMAGGTVQQYGKHCNIAESIDLKEESPPQITK